MFGLFKPAPLDGEAGFERGRENAERMLAQHGAQSEEAARWRALSQAPADRYDRGVAAALDAAGVPDPLAMLE